MFYPYYFDPTMILLVPAILFTMYAQMKINSAYGRYSKVGTRNNITGAQAARIILDRNGLHDVKIEFVNGKLSDHYDPRVRVLRLSSGVYNSTSIASVGIAAHECGHAIQHANSYSLLKFRNTIVPVVNFASNLAWPLLIFGLLFSFPAAQSFGILAFVLVVVFHLVTFPVEVDASGRALKQLTDNGIVYNEELGGAKKVISAAAMTYLAALATAIMNLLRIVIIARRDD